ncbi:YggS family pyridoxal phosphate-dependent enzyme [Corynebacterium sphenisci]|uniref:YggS family pyridoxal phosphate-dependent enzyme n=1 Tax=Corynebacterium sphenisci TaxID=191493 RepID=UPI0026E0C563|nr:YggS family pyridoxal phosphate-dependent enzyme [Corynebacterium sphenisci]MDO5731007.1 YggS family pyridoxal phosphate-dependent enzyme [Corynebacterium sphenisci]
MSPDPAPAPAPDPEDRAPEAIAARFAAVRARVAAAAAAAGRDPGEVRLLPVSKTVPAGVLGAAWPHLAAAGVTALAENRVQEAAAKAAELTGPRWAVIGPLQTNKAGRLAAFADEFHALDRPKVADALQRRLAERQRVLEVLIQVNTSAEPQKAGTDPAGARDLVAALAAGRWPNLRLRGLMTMAMPDDGTPAGAAAVRGCFSRLRELRAELAGDFAADLPEGALAELSMGMSGDFGAAIAEGATQVRVGRAIFGARKPAAAG